jgi:hypothetical protein
MGNGQDMFKGVCCERVGQIKVEIADKKKPRNHPGLF